MKPSLLMIIKFLINIHIILYLTTIHVQANGDFKQCSSQDTSCHNKGKANLKPEDLDRLCQECRLTGQNIDDLTRRPRNSESQPDSNRIDLDKIKKLVCRDYMKDEDRQRCRDFYFSNLPTIIDWKESRPEVTFQDYICIQKLKYCCPKNSFGPRCRRCPNCKPNEQCQGEGLRTGNGTCICKDGHSGPNCMACLEGYFAAGEKRISITKTTEQDVSEKDSFVNETICRKCHHSCEFCRADGPDSCEACKKGFRFIPDYGCSDIDECVREKDICGRNTFCVNTEGSYFCYECDKGCDGCHGDGPDNCLRCAFGFEMKEGVCTATKGSLLKPEAHYARYIIYLGLAVTSLILYNQNIYLSGAIGLVGAIYAGGSEYFLATNLPAT